LFAALAVAPGTSVASTAIFHDYFDAAPCTVPNPADPQFQNCDVVGAKTDFDIQKAVFQYSANSLSLDIYTNYRNSNVAPLSAFAVGSVSLPVADLFFGTSAGMLWGVPLVTHGAFQAGNVYALGNGVSTLTAQGVLGAQPSAYFRRNRIVYMSGNSTAAAQNNRGTGTVTVLSTGKNGTSTGQNPGAEYIIRVQLSQQAAQNVLAAAFDRDGIVAANLQLLACGNDILDGSFVVPEPSSWMLMGVVAAGLGFGVWRKRRSAIADPPASPV
jgi:hypothetical protein